MQIILFIIWLIAAVFKLSYPVFSFNEMGFIPPVILHNIAPHLWWVVRLISVASIFFVIFAITKKLQLKTISLFILITSPWLFILARELNIWVDLLLIIFACILIVKKKSLFMLFWQSFLFSYSSTIHLRFNV